MMQGIQRHLLPLIALVLLLIVSTTATAQGNLAYGSGALGSISAEAPLAIFTFNGTEGDLVIIQILSVTPGFVAGVGLNAPTQQQLAFSTGDPFNPGGVNITQRLSQSGVHTIIVSAVESVGEFAIRLDGSPAADPLPLSADAPAEESANTESSSLIFSVQGSVDAEQTLVISSDTPGFAFSVALRNANGQTLAVLNGSDTQAVFVTVPATNANFEVEVRPAVAGTNGNIQLALTTTAPPDAEATADDTDDQDVTPTATPTASADVPAPATTEEVEAVCRARNNSPNAVNIRSGPATNFDVVSTLQPNNAIVVVGVNNDWLSVVLEAGNRGWLFAGVVVLDGPCDNLPFVDEAAAPQQQAENTATPPAAQATATTAPNQPTATATSTPLPVESSATATTPPTATQAAAQPTATFTPSFTPTTPPPAQVAPEDARFNNALNIPLDNTASVLDFVSFPSGDTEDRIRYSVTGMNPNSALSGGRARLVIAASCFGEGTDSIQFFTGGQTFSCGQTLVDREVTADSDTGSIVITAVGGSSTYIQWVLTGTATRIN